LLILIIIEYTFELNKLKNYYGKLCPCLVVNRTTAIKDNFCPCKEFIDTGNCRCGLFNKVE